MSTRDSRKFVSYFNLKRKTAANDSTTNSLSSAPIHGAAGHGTTVNFTNTEVFRALAAYMDTAHETTPPTQHAGYAMFLLPSTKPYKQGVVRTVVEYCVKKFQPNPVIAHVELLFPSGADGEETSQIQLATYMDTDHADWQNAQDDPLGAFDYYLLSNGARWRAIPITGNCSVKELRSIADDCVGAPYSLLMYLTSVPPLRALARYIGDTPKHRGHCAVVTARIMRRAGCGKYGAHRPSAWYGPSTLFRDMIRRYPTNHPWANVVESTHSFQNHSYPDAHNLVSNMPSSRSVQEMGDARCARVVQGLAVQTSRAIVAANGEYTVAVDRASQDLAKALLSWQVLRR